MNEVKRCDYNGLPIEDRDNLEILDAQKKLWNDEALLGYKGQLKSYSTAIDRVLRIEAKAIKDAATKAEKEATKAEKEATKAAKDAAIKAEKDATKAAKEAATKAAKEATKAAKEATKAAKDAAIKAEKDATKDATTALLVQYIEDNDLHYATDEDKIYVFNVLKHQWLKFQERYYTKSRTFINENRGEFYDALNGLGRVKDSAVYSFNDCGKGVLNLMDKARDAWVKPFSADEDTPPLNIYHDIMLTSLSDNNQTVRDHIEQCITWKYLHPEDHQLPALVMSGGGGSGKTEFISYVLASLFGEDNVGVMGFADGFAGFSGMRLGKTVILIDEAPATREAAEQLKQIVGNKLTIINEKFGKQGIAEQTAWIIIASQSTVGAIQLDGSASDRRWSIIYQKENIIHWTQKALHIDDYNTARQRYADEAHDAYTNVDNTRVLISYLINKWGNRTSRPAPLHGELYQQTVRKQQKPYIDYIEDVFNSNNFEFISNPVLYNGYKTYIEENAPSGKNYMIGKKTLLMEVDRWIENNNVKGKVIKLMTVNVKNSVGARSSAIGYGIKLNVDYTCPKDLYYFGDSKIFNLELISPNNTLTIVKNDERVVNLLDKGKKRGFIK